MESGREVGRQPFCRSGVGEGNLHRVEVPGGPRYGELHGVELVDEVIHLLGGYTPLAIGYIQKGDYLKSLLGRKGEGTPVGVDHPSQYLLDSFPVTILSQRFI